MQMGGRGGAVGGRGGLTSGPRGGRGGTAGGNRGGLAGRGRGGSSGYLGGPSGGRGGGSGPPSGPLRGHGSRGNFGNKDFHNRRGGGGSFTAGNAGGNYQGSFNSRGRNQGHSGSNRGPRHEGSGGGGTNFGSREGTMASSFSGIGKKDENRRTLTDFKIVGLEIPELGWIWGSVSVKTEKRTEVKEDVKEEPIAVPEISIQMPPKDVLDEDIVEVVNSGDAEQSEPNTEDTANLPDSASSIPPDVNALPETPASTLPARVSAETNAASPPPSRIRIYFHTPVTPDDSRPIPHTSSYGDAPTDTRKGKRKKLEDDDGDLEEGRTRPPPPQMGGGLSDDRSSAAVSAPPSVAETASEADWLMAAIVEGEDEAEAEGELQPGEDDEDDDRLHVSEHLKVHDNDDSLDIDGDIDLVDGELLCIALRSRALV